MRLSRMGYFIIRKYFARFGSDDDSACRVIFIANCSLTVMIIVAPVSGVHPYTYIFETPDVS